MGMTGDEERRLGIQSPIQMYPMFENAIRHHRASRSLPIVSESRLYGAGFPRWLQEPQCLDSRGRERRNDHDAVCK